MAQQSPILEIKDLHISYGPIVAVEKLNMSINKGSVVAVLGANGAGKTSLLKKISGIIPAQKGDVIYKGENITRLAPERITKKGIIQSPEGRQIFGDLTVYENLMIGAFTVMRGEVPIKLINPEALPKRLKKEYEDNKDNSQHTLKMSRDEIVANNMARVHHVFPVLKERGNQMAVTLSGGEQQMLAIGRALMNRPELLILDEPSLGLAPLIVRDIFKIIKDLNDAGTTVLIIEQNALQTLKIADYAYVLQTGNLIKEGKAKDLINDEELIEAYLGKH